MAGHGRTRQVAPAPAPLNNANHGEAKKKKKSNNANSDRIFTSGSLAGQPMPPPRDPSATCSACSTVGHKQNTARTDSGLKRIRRIELVV